MLNWSSQKKTKKKTVHFCQAYFVRKKCFWHSGYISTNSVLIILQNIYTFTYQKTLLHRFLLLVFKLSKAFNVSLKGISEVCFSFNVNVSTSLKFLWSLDGLSKGPQAFGHSEDTWTLGDSKGTQGLKYLGHSCTWVLRALRYFRTQALWNLE